MHAERVATVWDLAVFGHLSGLIGHEKAQGISSRFYDDLQLRFLDATDMKLLEKEAHITHSSAGMLGFTDLSGFARDLETACQTDTGVTEALASISSAKQLALKNLKDHLSQGASWNPAHSDPSRPARGDHQLVGG